jgi:hypothetical protein
MRYYEISEARRNPISQKTGKELNPRVPLTDKLEQYKDRDDIFISYVMDMGDLQPKGGKNISGFKVGINPKSRYNTPNGIYLYPLKEAWKSYYNPRKRILDVPFAGEQPQVGILQVDMNRAMDLKTYNSRMWDQDYDKLARMIEEFFMKKNRQSEALGWEAAKSILAAANDGARIKTPGGRFWNMSRFTYFCLTSQLRTSFKDEYQDELIDMMSDKTLKANRTDHTVRFNIHEMSNNDAPTNKWTLILIELGYSTIIDRAGQSIIHPSEPMQAVALDPSGYKVIDSHDNKGYERLNASLEANDAKVSIMVREWLKHKAGITMKSEAFKMAQAVRHMVQSYESEYSDKLNVKMDTALSMALDKLKVNLDAEKNAKKLPDEIEMKSADGGFIKIGTKKIDVLGPQKVSAPHMKKYGKKKTIRTFKLKDFNMGNWQEWGDALAFHAQAVMAGSDPDNHSIKINFPDDDWDD